MKESGILQDVLHSAISLLMVKKGSLSSQLLLHGVYV